MLKSLDYKIVNNKIVFNNIYNYPRTLIEINNTVFMADWSSTLGWFGLASRDSNYDGYYLVGFTSVASVEYGKSFSIYTENYSDILKIVVTLHEPGSTETSVIELDANNNFTGVSNLDTNSGFAFIKKIQVNYRAGYAVKPIYICVQDRFNREYSYSFSNINDIYNAKFQNVVLQSSSLGTEFGGEVKSLFDMRCVLYNNSSENNRLDKELYLEEVGSFNIVFKDSVSVTSPVIVLNSIWLNKANYCYLPIFNRYYYIDDIVSIKNNIWEIYLRCDVLMSFKKEIQNLDCFIERQEFKFNNFVPDNLIPAKVPEKVTKIDSENEFSIDSSTQVKVPIPSPFKHIDDMYNYTFITNFAYRDYYFILNVSAALLGDRNIEGVFDTLPKGVSSSGCVSYLLNLDDLRKFITGLWTKTFWTDFELLFNNKSDGLISLFMYPIPFLTDKITIATLSHSYSSVIFNDDYKSYLESGDEIVFGNITTNFESNTFKPYLIKTTTKPISLNVGRFDFYGGYSFYDYSPYSKYAMFLPYYGYIDFDLALFKNINSKFDISVKYDLDITTGKCLCKLIDNNDREIVKMIQEIQLGYNIPLTSSSLSDNIRNAVFAGAKAVISTVSGFIGTDVSTVTKGGSKVNYNRAGKVSSVSRSQSTSYEKKLALDVEGGIQGAVKGMGYTINAASEFMSHIQMGGSMSGWNIENLPTEPFIIKRTPNYYYPSNYNHLVGRPCNETHKLSELKGFTVVSNMHMDGFPNTLPQELDEIEQILTNGVIL